MKHLSFIVLLLSACSQLSGMENKITILQRKPNAIAETKILVPSNVIYDRLCALHLNNFVHQTRIHEKIGSQEGMVPGKIALEINSAICSYLQNVHQRKGNSQFIEEHRAFIQQKKAPIIKAILQDHPQALEYLIKEGFLKEQPIEQNNSLNIPIITLSPKPKKFLSNKTREERQIMHWQAFINNQ